MRLDSAPLRVPGPNNADRSNCSFARAQAPCASLRGTPARPRGHCPRADAALRERCLTRSSRDDLFERRDTSADCCGTASHRRQPSKPSGGTHWVLWSTPPSRRASERQPCDVGRVCRSVGNFGFRGICDLVHAPLMWCTEDADDPAPSSRRRRPASGSVNWPSRPAPARPTEQHHERDGGL